MYEYLYILNTYCRRILVNMQTFGGILHFKRVPSHAASSNNRRFDMNERDMFSIPRTFCMALANENGMERSRQQDNAQALISLNGRTDFVTAILKQAHEHFILCLFFSLSCHSLFLLFFAFILCYCTNACTPNSFCHCSTLQKFE